jgi:hypothetical protein
MLQRFVIIKKMGTTKRIEMLATAWLATTLEGLTLSMASSWKPATTQPWPSQALPSHHQGLLVRSRKTDPTKIHSSFQKLATTGHSVSHGLLSHHPW